MYREVLRRFSKVVVSRFPDSKNRPPIRGKKESGIQAVFSERTTDQEREPHTCVFARWKRESGRRGWGPPLPPLRDCGGADCSRVHRLPVTHAMFLAPPFLQPHFSLVEFFSQLQGEKARARRVVYDLFFHLDHTGEEL